LPSSVWPAVPERNGGRRSARQSAGVMAGERHHGADRSAAHSPRHTPSDRSSDLRRCLERAGVWPEPFASLRLRPTRSRAGALRRRAGRSLPGRSPRLALRCARRQSKHAGRVDQLPTIQAMKRLPARSTRSTACGPPGGCGSRPAASTTASARPASASSRTASSSATGSSTRASSSR
jgi:hypothetical protein